MDKPAVKGDRVLTGLAVGTGLWLIAAVWSAHGSISASSGAVALTAAAYALPGLLAAGLVAGLAGGAVALRRADHGRSRPGAARVAIAGTGGAVVAALAGGGLSLLAGGDAQQLVLAANLTVAALVGGLLASLATTATARSLLAAALVTGVLGAAAGFARGPVLDWIDPAGPAGRTAAESWYAIAVAVLSGLAAGVTAFGTRRGSAGGWPTYLVVGAGPGAFLLLAEVITRVGGAPLLSLAAQISDADRTLRDWLDDSRLNHALVVLFLGAITAMIGYGRTLESAPTTG